MSRDEQHPARGAEGKPTESWMPSRTVAQKPWPPYCLLDRKGKDIFSQLPRKSLRLAFAVFGLTHHMLLELAIRLCAQQAAMAPETPLSCSVKIASDFPFTLAPGGTRCFVNVRGQLREAPTDQHGLQTGRSSGFLERIPSAVKVKRAFV